MNEKQRAILEAFRRCLSYDLAEMRKTGRTEAGYLATMTRIEFNAKNARITFYNLGMQESMDI